MRSLLSLLKTRRRTPNGNSDPPKCEQLRQHLQSAQIWSPLYAAESFVPVSELKALIEPRTVQGILKGLDKQPSDSHEKLSATIVEKAPRLFALLVWIGQARRVFDLGTQYLDDASLPLDEHGVELAKLRDTLGWDAECEAKIMRDQWIFLAPVFQTDGQPIGIPSSAPLPFISAALVTKESDNRTVRQVRLHPSHIRFLSDGSEPVTPCVVALKLFEPRASKRFKHEVHILQLLNQRPNRNIVKLLVAFSSQNTRGILFPWAECDLSEMTKRLIPPSQRCELGPWILHQFIGLLEGLAAIHCIPESSGGHSHLQCRHGDLRPANILLMKESKTSFDHPTSIEHCRLQIASMAMTQVFQHKSQYTVPSETGTYQGPECYLETAIGPLYDIWSLGALFLELMVWFLEGPDGVESFADERIASDPLLGERVQDDYFFTLNVEDERYVGAEVRPSVLSSIKRLQNDERVSSTLVASLHVIANHMLVPIGNQRLGAQELSRKLMGLVDVQEGDKKDV